MLEKFEIENYKSINECSVELGRFNIFIGENGCGKSNILEAMAMLSLGKFNSEITTEELYNKGVRVANPRLTLSSFKGKKTIPSIKMYLTKKSDALSILRSELIPNKEDIYSSWIDVNDKELSNEQEPIIKTIEETLANKFGDISSDKSKAKLEGIISPMLRDNIISYYASSYARLFFPELKDYTIYNIETKALRGIISESKKQPLGINGEGLDILIADFNKKEFSELLKYSKFISWFANIEIDKKDSFKYKGHKLGKSNSLLYFKDRFMNLKNNIFSAENANEGILHILFYLALFISKKTPQFFAIDNIEKSLNPKLCRTLIKELADLSKDNDKQVLITTHNPAILDGLNLYDNEQRLFVVSRTDDGYTKIERIKLKPEKEPKLKLSEMWMRGYLGGVPNNF